MTDAPELLILKSFARKLDQISDLLALNAVKGVEEIDQIRMLRRIGMSFPDIGRYLGLSGTAARLRVHRSKKRKKGAKGARQKRN
jgi:hypothetical protein